MIDVQPRHAEIIRSILQQHVPDAVAYVFGSRANFTAKPHSDLDLVIEGKAAIPIGRLYALEEAFEESDLPFRVDVMDWHAISAEFREQIGNCRKMIGAK